MCHERDGRRRAEELWGPEVAVRPLALRSSGNAKQGSSSRAEELAALALRRGETISRAGSIRRSKGAGRRPPEPMKVYVRHPARRSFLRLRSDLSAEAESSAGAASAQSPESGRERYEGRRQASGELIRSALWRSTGRVRYLASFSYVVRAAALQKTPHVE